MGLNGNVMSHSLCRTRYVLLEFTFLGSIVYDINRLKYLNDDKQRGTAMAPAMKLQELDNPLLRRAGFELMRELRPHLTDEAAFGEQIARQCAQGYRLLGAYLGERIVGLIGYRATENLLYGRFVYVDDLVIDTGERQRGLGAFLITAARNEATRLGCQHLVLDTGLHMALAQRFYFRQGLLARGMHFVQALKQPQQDLA
jgi:GNAT superfamily N-acetyltransferase